MLATADGDRYVGERARSSASDTFALETDGGTDCDGKLRPAAEAGTDRPAALGGVNCSDGTSGVLLFSGVDEKVGGPVSGVIDRRPVEGRWGARVRHDGAGT